MVRRRAGYCPFQPLVFNVIDHDGANYQPIQAPFKYQSGLILLENRWRHSSAARAGFQALMNLCVISAGGFIRRRKTG